MELTPDEPGPLLHADQSESPAATGDIDVEPHAIVTHAQGNVAVLARQSDHDPPGPAVDARIANGFLADPEEREPHSAADRLDVGADSQIQIDVVDPPDLEPMRFEGCAKANLMEHCG